jgi:hypothetical protein
MGNERPFDVAKPRTPKGAARLRERIALNAIRNLTEIEDEEKFKDILINDYGIKAGQPRYEAALSAWREALASKRPHR